MTRILVTLLLLLFLLPTNSHALENSYLTTLITKSQQQQLALTPGWQSLIHYRSALTGNHLLSEADDDNFFFSVDGNKNPALRSEERRVGKEC